MYAPPCSWRTGTNCTDEFSSDSFRSSVSSPGMPKTCFTPSASRHSTKTSDAFRAATLFLLPGTGPADYDNRNMWAYTGFKEARYPRKRRVPVGVKPMRKTLFTTLLLGLLAAPASADAATRWVVKGAGWGHGIGMSQYGAHGMARDGKSYREIIGHFYTDTTIGQAQTRTIR